MRGGRKLMAWKLAPAQSRCEQAERAKLCHNTAVSPLLASSHVSKGYGISTHCCCVPPAPSPFPAASVPTSASPTAALRRPEGHEPPSVLLPGCGLARLCCEVAGLGFQAQGNEFSYHMLLTSSFILNQVHEANQYTIFPWMHSNCNQFSNAQQLRAVSLPDVAPADLVAAPGLLSMCAGDFVVSITNEAGEVAQRGMARQGG